MRFVMFYHSLVSDWNHGNAHFLRGVCSELVARGHDVTVYEPEDGWSRENLLRDHGTAPLEAFAARYPTLRATCYRRGTLDLDTALDGADVVIVHEWTDPEIVAAVGAHRARRGGYRLLFHDTHHRAVTDPAALALFDLGAYDAVLVFGQALEDIYRKRGWARHIFTWHEAADTRVFAPLPPPDHDLVDVVWIGNWGDDERAAELEEFLLDPVRQLGLRTEIWGVRYPQQALEALARAGVAYRGWLPNFEVPRALARARLTVHVPRRPYAASLPGIPTIRPFEAMACGVPLLSAPWRDTEGLFRRGTDHLMADSGRQMRTYMGQVLSRPALGRGLAMAARETIAARHTCGHRVDQLLGILGGLASRNARAA